MLKSRSLGISRGSPIGDWREMSEYPSRLASAAIEFDLILTGCAPEEAKVRVTGLPDGWVEDRGNRLFGGEVPVSVWFSPIESYGNGMPFSDNAVLVVYKVEGSAWREHGSALVSAAIEDSISIPGWSALGDAFHHGGADQDSVKVVGMLESPYGSLLSIVTTSYVKGDECDFLVQLTVTSLMSSSVVSSTDPAARIDFASTV